MWAWTLCSVLKAAAQSFVACSNRGRFRARNWHLVERQGSHAEDLLGHTWCPHTIYIGTRSSCQPAAGNYAPVKLQTSGSLTLRFNCTGNTILGSEEGVMLQAPHQVICTNSTTLAEWVCTCLSASSRVPSRDRLRWIMSKKPTVVFAT